MTEQPQEGHLLLVLFVLPEYKINKLPAVNPGAKYNRNLPHVRPKSYFQNSPEGDSVLTRRVLLDGIADVI
jgi:hypothetical protein